MDVCHYSLLVTCEFFYSIIHVVLYNCKTSPYQKKSSKIQHKIINNRKNIRYLSTRNSILTSTLDVIR